MIGCASLEGTDPAQLALPLSFLHHLRCAPDEWRARRTPGCASTIDMLPPRTIDRQGRAARAAAADQGLSAARRLCRRRRGDRPPVRHDRRAGDLPVEAIDERYFGHFGGPDDPIVAPGGKKLS